MSLQHHPETEEPGRGDDVRSVRLTMQALTVPGRRRRGKREVEGMSTEELERLIVTLEEEIGRAHV